MDSNIINMDTPFYGDLPPRQVLEKAAEADMAKSLVVCVTSDDQLYIASSIGNIAESYTLLKLAASRLERMMDEQLG